MGWRVLGSVFLLFILLVTPVSAATPASNVAQQLICQCGCTLTVANCTHENCSSRIPMEKTIAEKLDSGMSEAQVVQYFVSVYGEQVMAVPPKKGFNLVAWLLPFAVIIGGALAIYIALKRWVWKGKTVQVEATPAEEGDNKKYERRLEQELKNFTEKGFR